MLQNLSSDQPQEGGTYTQTIVQTVHAETAPACSHFPFLICALLFFPLIFSYPHHPSFSVVPACLSLIPHYCLIICEQTRHIVLLVFVRWSWLSYVNAGSGLTASKLGSHAGLLFVKLGELVQPHRPLRGEGGKRSHKEMSRWVREEEGEQESTRFSQGSQNWHLAAADVDLVISYSFLYKTPVNLYWHHPHAQLKISLVFYLDRCKVILSWPAGQRLGPGSSLPSTPPNCHHRLRNRKSCGVIISRAGMRPKERETEWAWDQEQRSEVSGGQTDR